MLHNDSDLPGIHHMTRHPQTEEVTTEEGLKWRKRSPQYWYRNCTYSAVVVQDRTHTHVECCPGEQRSVLNTMFMPSIPFQKLELETFFLDKTCSISRVIDQSDCNTSQDMPPLFFLSVLAWAKHFTFSYLSSFQ